MKSAAPTLLLAAVLALTGCTSTSSLHSARQPSVEAPGQPTAAAKLFIHSAVYGSGAKFADVTYRVNDLLRQPDLVFQANPAWLDADPTPGWNKALVIVYEAKGRRQIFTTSEGGEVGAKILLRNRR